MDHGDLVSLFQEFREFIRPEVVNGVPDFTAAAMKKQYSGLQQLQKRLAAFDIRNWSVAHQVDYHVVRAEMNGVEFDHRVLRQWARDPGFYNLTDGIYPRLLVHHSRSLSNWGLYKPEVPLPENKVADFRVKLETVPKLFAQAKINLTEAAGDLATVRYPCQGKRRRDAHPVSGAVCRTLSRAGLHCRPGGDRYGRFS